MKSVTVKTTINKSPEVVWEHWTKPDHIKRWYFASDDWAVGDVTNDVRVGGRFKTNMHAKDQSAGFDFTGTYTKVDKPKAISFTIDDDRKVDITFERQGSSTVVSETFELEGTHSEEMQRGGWQAILDNFRKLVEQG